MNNKAIITALLLITVCVVGLQLAQSVSAAKDPSRMDSGSFTVKKNKITYNAWQPDVNNDKNTLFIYFNGKGVPKKYQHVMLQKTSKNQIKAYSMGLGYDQKLLKTFKTTKSVKSYYKDTYKKSIINTVKKSIK